MRNPKQAIIVRMLLPLMLAFIGLPAFSLSYNDLLSMPMRPTIEVVGENIEAIPDEPGIPVAPDGTFNGYGLHFQYWLETLINGLPYLIVQMEKASPGARFAFLGRDVHAIADAMAAFYASIGQHDRVIYLGGSKASYVGTSEETLVAFIESHGFPLADAQNARPFFIVDTISRGHGTQGRALINAVYKEYERRGGQPADLVRKFNMIGLVAPTYPRGAPINDISNASAIFATQEDAYRQNPKRAAYGADHLILMFQAPKVAPQFNESGYAHYVSAWHREYGAFAYINGRTAPVPGDYFPNPQQYVAHRKSILWLQKHIWQRVQSADFRQKVQSVMAQYSLPGFGPNHCSTVF
jgi:hypothetical protein